MPYGAETLVITVFVLFMASSIAVCSPHDRGPIIGAGGLFLCLLLTIAAIVLTGSHLGPS